MTEEVGVTVKFFGFTSAFFFVSIFNLNQFSKLHFSEPNARQEKPEQPYSQMSTRIITALSLSSDEKIILRFDPKTMPQLERELSRSLKRMGLSVQSLRYGNIDNFKVELEKADVYIWLPAGPQAITNTEQRQALAQWLDAGRGRQIHFHWGDGTRATDSMNGVHSEAYDEVYLNALNIDYQSLDQKMDRAIELFRSGTIRVTTPAGTDLQFQVGNRPFCKQNGDASKERMKTARVRIDREIELPAGALRVAPLEETVNGIVVIRSARINDVEINGIRLEFERGKIKSISSENDQTTLRNYITTNSGLDLFREFALGFNPKLVIPKDEKWIPYYGYGAGVVRLSLGDNLELGGNARGSNVRWFFFTEATVRVDQKITVNNGELVID